MSQGIEFHRETGELKLHTDQGVLVGTPENTQAYLHGFAYRGVDHIYVHDEVDDGYLSVILFRSASDVSIEGFDSFIDSLRDYGFPISLSEEPTLTDLERFNAQMDYLVDRISTDDLERPWELS